MKRFLITIVTIIIISLLLIATSIPLIVVGYQYMSETGSNMTCHIVTAYQIDYRYRYQYERNYIDYPRVQYESPKSICELYCQTWIHVKELGHLLVHNVDMERLPR
jgi:hypothetical protein